MGWPAAGQPTQPEPVCEQTALAHQVWHTLLRPSGPGWAAQSQLRRPAELGVAELRWGEGGRGVLSPTPCCSLATGDGVKWPACLLLELFLAGCLQDVGVGHFWLGSLSGQNAQKEWTAEGMEAIAWWRQEKHNEGGQHPAVSPKSTDSPCCSSMDRHHWQSLNEMTISYLKAGGSFPSAHLGSFGFVRAPGSARSPRSFPRVPSPARTGGGSRWPPTVPSQAREHVPETSCYPGGKPSLTPRDRPRITEDAPWEHPFSLGCIFSPPLPRWLCSLHPVSHMSHPWGTLPQTKMI